MCCVSGVPGGKFTNCICVVADLFLDHVRPIPFLCLFTERTQKRMGLGRDQHKVTRRQRQFRAIFVKTFLHALSTTLLVIAHEGPELLNSSSFVQSPIAGRQRYQFYCHRQPEENAEAMWDDDQKPVDEEICHLVPQQSHLARIETVGASLPH